MRGTGLGRTVIAFIACSQLLGFGPLGFTPLGCSHGAERTEGSGDEPSNEPIASTSAEAAPPPLGPPLADWSREIVSTKLAVDVASRSAVATITVGPGPAANASFEVGDLSIVSVKDGAGAALPYLDRGKELDVSIRPGAAATIVVSYVYVERDKLEGANKGGYTFTFPYFCENLFPCRSRKTPEDGTSFELTLTGVPAGQRAIYPKTIEGHPPAYMLAWAIGAYEYKSLGKTTAGTEVGIYYKKAEEKAALHGSRSLRGAFDWLEKSLGPYRYGNEVASVSVDFPPYTFGGMEHHPFWHVGDHVLDVEEVHVHEAAHGWFGNGVRMKCWSDLLLSEGTTTYLAGRAIEAVAPARGAAYWRHYDQRLTRSRSKDVAWPKACDADILDMNLEGPYVRGALFLRALERRVGRPAFDAALRDFYAAHVVEAAGVTDLVEHFAKKTGYDPAACAETWLHQTAVPKDRVCPK